jgi:hypothetical protein
MSAIFLDEKVGDHMCGICKKRKAKRRLTFSLDGNHLTYMCDLCFDDIRHLMTDTFWIGSRKTRAELEKENPIILSRGS